MSLATEKLQERYAHHKKAHHDDDRRESDDVDLFSRDGTRPHPTPLHALFLTDFTFLWQGSSWSCTAT